MIYVGIDVAKDKYDCFILSFDGEVLSDILTIPNNTEDFDKLLQTFRSCSNPWGKRKVCTPMSSSRCTPTFTEKASAFVKRR